MRHVLAAAAALAITGSVQAAVRDVQIVKIDLTTNVVILENLGDTAQSLATYRFCTADDDQQLRYTGAGGLAAFTLDPGDQLFVHWNDDAPADPDRVNVSDLGGFSAQPMDHGPFGLAIYWAIPFTVPTNMADYVQWTDDLSNPGNAMADARADEAAAGGLWTGMNDFKVTNPDSTMITLNDLSGAELHGPDDYDVDGGGAECPQDLDMSGDVGFADLLQVLSSWGPCTGCPQDFDMSGDVGFADLLTVLSSWGPCV